MIVPILVLEETRLLKMEALCQKCIFHKEGYLCDLDFVFNEHDFFCSEYDEQKDEYPKDILFHLAVNVRAILDQSICSPQMKGCLTFTANMRQSLKRKQISGLMKR